MRLHLRLSAAVLQRSKPHRFSFFFPFVAKCSSSLFCCNQPSSSRFVLIHYTHTDSKYYILFLMSFVCATGILLMSYYLSLLSLQLI